jgi:glycosyltransferase involved in cell wall biosynthesis
LLFVGRLDPLKGLDSLLEALRLLNDGDSRTPQFSLKIVGAGSATYLRQLQAQAEDLGIAHCVEYVGYKANSEVMSFFRQADVFVLPTLAENLARTIWEAMSQSCPVVTTPVGGQGRVFQDKVDLLFCRPADSMDIAEQIRSLAANAELCERLTRRGLELARGNTLEIRSKELLDTVYAWLNTSATK